jgi:uncharacterized protein
MKMSLDSAAGVNVIRSYTTGCVSTSRGDYRCSVIVSASRIIADWTPTGVAGLRAKDLHPLLDEPPEVVILGTGERQVFPEPAVFSVLMDLGIGFEVMDNAAACRTYNILLAEQRRVTLALLMDTEPS